MLEELGAERVELEVPELSKRIAEADRLDAVLDLVGNSTILDSLDMLPRRARLPGGLARWPRPDRQLQPAAANGKLSDVPLQTIAEQAAAGRLRAKPSRVFRFEEIREAHRVMEAGEARGKMVVVHG
jgi:NADPH:quinone reductase-like Zn-dependent oxidoreductase